MKFIYIIIITNLLINLVESQACSVLYYRDAKTGKVFAVNNEDYWYDTNPYIQIQPKSRNKLARLWYGWENFAQGGINEAGLFFDVAVTPGQEKIPGYSQPKDNLGDKILSYCTNVNEALAYLEERKIALTKSHMLFGDKTGRAVIVEWINGSKQLHWIKDNKLIMTNFLLSDSTQKTTTCQRYKSINQRLKELEEKNTTINLLRVGNVMGQAIQPPRTDKNGRTGGTLYTSFINISDMDFVLSYKTSNTNMIKLDLLLEFSKTKKQKIKMEELKTASPDN